MKKLSFISYSLWHLWCLLMTEWNFLLPKAFLLIHTGNLRVGRRKWCQSGKISWLMVMSIFPVYGMWKPLSIIRMVTQWLCQVTARWETQDLGWSSKPQSAPEVLGQGIHTFVLTRKLSVKLVNWVSVRITFFFWRILSFLSYNIYSVGFFMLNSISWGTRKQSGF